MAGSITINGNDVLEYHSGFFQILYYKMREIIDENNLHLTPQLEEFMKGMQFSAEGMLPFFEVTDYITKSVELNNLVNILEITIKSISDTTQDSTIKALWNFHKKLMEYGDKLQLT